MSKDAYGKADLGEDGRSKMDRENNALVTVISRISDGAHHDASETVYPGKAFEKDGCCYVFYDEHDEDTGAVTKASLRLRPGHIEIRKTGNVTTRMTFIPGQQSETEYKTPYGTMFMTIDTKRAEVEYGVGEVEAELYYELLFGGSAPMGNRMKIAVRYIGGENRAKI